MWKDDGYMTYIAHRLLCLALLAGLLMVTGCKSATPADSAQTTSGDVVIPTPDPTPAADVVVNTPTPVEANAVQVSEPVAAQPMVEAAPVVETKVQTQAKVEAVAVTEVESEAPAPLWSLKYPKAKEQFAGDVDITVIQDRKSIKLTNRTVHSFNDVQVWVNQRYVSRVASIPVGKTTSIALKSLMNQYGEKYPTPGIFRPDRSFPALLVEIYEPNQNKRYRLIVQKTHSQF
jgi:hypothetical protein